MRFSRLSVALETEHKARSLGLHCYRLTADHNRLVIPLLIMLRWAAPATAKMWGVLFVDRHAGPSATITHCCQLGAPNIEDHKIYISSNIEVGTRGQTRPIIPARDDPDSRASALCVRSSPCYACNARGYAVLPEADIRCHAVSHQYRES